jgi:hypothetical protein
MLYSLNGAYPKFLPKRIILSNGTTRTDPTTFTPEEIADAGYVAAPDPPSTGTYESLSWSGTEWVLTEVRTLEKAKQLKLTALSNIRRYYETQFEFNGVSIYLDQQTQARINAAVAGFAFRPDDTISWEVTRGNFVDFNKATMEALAVAAWTHVKQCYETVKTVTAVIQACTTIAEVDAVDIESPWVVNEG